MNKYVKTLNWQFKSNRTCVCLQLNKQVIKTFKLIYQQIYFTHHRKNIVCTICEVVEE